MLVLSMATDGLLSPAPVVVAPVNISDLVTAIEASTVLAKASAVAAIPTTPLLAANYVAPPTAAQILTTPITEAYAASGAAPTLAQILCMIYALLGETSITGTTLTAKKLDRTTPAMTFTLDSATAPTSKTRSS